MPMREQIAMRYDLHMNAGSEDAEIMVYGHIVPSKSNGNETNPDVTAKEFDKLLKDARNGGAKRLTLRINSGGGSVYQAVAMRTMLLGAGFDGLEIRIEGLCASAATLLACVPGSKVSIAEGAMYMIHNPSNIVWGDANDMEHEAQTLRKMESDVRGIYSKRCGKDDADLKKLMDAETWYTAKEAVEAGFADEMIEGKGLESASVDAYMAALVQSLYKHAPEMSYAMSKDTEEVSNENPAVAAVESTENKNETKEENHMEIKDATLEQLRMENPALHRQIMQAGAEQERERIQEIDDLTPAGYEEMAAEAKADGTSAMDFHKQIVKAQKQKGKEFMQARKMETAPTAQVTGAAAEDDSKQAEKQELDSFAKEMKAMAESMAQAGIDGGMF